MKIINKILHWLNVGIISIILLLAILLSLFKFSTPYFVAHQSDLEQFISKQIQQPVHIGRVAVGNHGLEPVLKFYDATVFDDTGTKTLLQIRELKVGIDLLSSLLKWHIEPGLLLAHGVNFLVYQDAAGAISISGVKSSINNFIADSGSTFGAFHWLFQQGKIELTGVSLIWCLPDNKELKFVDLKMGLDNGILQHNLKISGKFIQERVPAGFSIELKLRGDILRQEISSLTGEIIVDDWSFKLPHDFFGKKSILSQSGEVNILLKHSAFVSDIFRQPIPFDNLEGRIIWQNNNDGLNVKVSKLKYWDSWLTVHGTLGFLFPHGVDQNKTNPVVTKNVDVGSLEKSKRQKQPKHELNTSSGSNKPLSPITDISLDFNLINLAKAKLYYPVAALPPDATTWLDQAFISSKAMTGTIVLQGPIDQFPFDHKEGQFLVNANIRDVNLNYTAGWPILANINGKMIFANRSMTISVHSAETMQATVKSIQAVIPDLDLPILHVTGEVDTDSSIGLQFINSSPLKDSIAGKLQVINLTGPMRLILKMIVPISPFVKQKNTTVDGNINLNDNYLQPYDLNFGINNVQGDLHFTENDLAGTNIRGKLFNKPITIKVSTLHAKNDTVTQVVMQGSATTQDLAQGFAVVLNPYVTGDFKYFAALDLHSVNKENIFKLNSTLQGIAVDLPEPFAKKQNDKGVLDLTCQVDPDKPSVMKLNYNNQVLAALALGKTATNSWQITGGEIRFGSVKTKTVTVPGAGITIIGNIPKLDWSVWRNYLSQTDNSITKINAAIRSIDLNIAELRVLGRMLKQVILHANPQDNGWKIGLVTPIIQGEIFFPNNKAKQIKGIFAKLYLDSKTDMGVLEPKDLPPLYVFAKDFRWDNRSFAEIEFSTSLRVNGLDIDKVSINDPKFSLVADGYWLSVDDKQQSFLRGRIISSDIGKLLQHFAFTNNLVGGKGEANFALRWQDAPYKLSMNKMNGSFAMKAYDGRIINLGGKTETVLGLGRILNLLSLRNLSLGFGDWVKQGFLFSKMIGDVELTNGNAFTKGILLDGPIAQVKMRGRIGLAAQDYNLSLSVTPYVTSSVPVVAAFAGGPMIGALTWLADKIVSPIVKKAINYSYHVTGSWDQPVMTKI